VLFGADWAIREDEVVSFRWKLRRMRDDKIGSNSDSGMPASDEPSAMKVACPVHKAEWVAVAIRAGALHFFSDSSPIIQQP
jgi:hypothetical protein